MINIQALGNWFLLYDGRSIPGDHRIPFDELLTSRAKEESLNNRVADVTMAGIHLRTVGRKVVERGKTH